MKALALLCEAERLKWRRSWTLVVALLVPLFQLFFLFEIFWFSEVQVHRMGPGFLVWYQINQTAWNILFMPIAAALIAVMSWELEEDYSAWKHLLLQPVDRKFHYLAKLFSHLALVLFAQLVFATLLCLGGLTLRALVPKLLMGPVHLGLLLQTTLASMVASLPIVSLHTWLSARFPGLMYGLIATLGGSWLTVRLAETTALAGMSPWGMAVQTAAMVPKGGTFPWGFALAAVACAAVLAVLGGLDFLARKNQQA